MIHFILCGHGSYGSSLKESMSMLLPELEKISTIDFKKDMNQSELTEDIKSLLDIIGDQPTLIICDMVGGSPFKTSAVEILERKNKAVIGGLNLTAVLEIYFDRERDLKYVVNKAGEVTRNSIDYFPK